MIRMVVMFRYYPTALDVKPFGTRTVSRDLADGVGSASR